MRFTDDGFPLLEGRWYRLTDGRVVGPLTPDVSGDAKYLVVNGFVVPGYDPDDDTQVAEIIAKPKFPDPEPEPPKPDYSEFLEALTALTRNQGVQIAGCGCCGSPFLVNTENKDGHYVVDEENDNLEWKG